MTGKNESLSWKFYALNIVVLGALLAVVEIALGGFIKKAGLPLRSALLTGVGFAVLALGLAVFKQPRVIPGITALAMFSKWLAVPLLGLPLLCQANSLLALLLHGGFLYAGTTLFRKQVGKGRAQRGAVAFASALGSGAAFFVLGRFVAPCRHLLSFQYAGGAANYLLTRVFPAALLAALLFPLGYALGRQLEKRLFTQWLTGKTLLVPMAVAFTLACWGLSVLLIAWGF
jgi:hypothetical protein